MTSFARRNSLLLYFLFTFAWFWGCLALGSFNRFRFWVPILGALAPGLAAVVVSGVSEGEHEIRALLRRLVQWRVGSVWYLIALGLPIAENLFIVGVAILRGHFSIARVPPVLPVLPALWLAYLFAAGEELGWRGFALPRLLATRTGLAASLILGAVHAVWHWPLILLPHQWLSGVPLVPYTAFVVSEAIVFTWIFQSTRGSALLATLFHGSSNAAMLFYDGIDPAWGPWLKSSTSVLVALAVLLRAGPHLKRAQPS